MADQGRKGDVLDHRPDNATFSTDLPGLRYEAIPTSPPTAEMHSTSEPSQKGNITPPIRSWTPVALRWWYAAVLVTFMLLVAVGLEVALHFSNQQNGWKVASALSATTGILHFVYTLPPVAVAMVIVALWAWTDADIKKLQPYIDLAYGNAPASRTLLLDYGNRHPAIVTVAAYHHGHYIVTMSSLMVLIGLAVQPLAASLFTVKDTWWNGPDINVASFESLGLNPTFANLTAFSTAAGFVQASVLYNLPPPNFVNPPWAIPEIHVPNDQVANGTMFANITSVRSIGNCKAGETSSLSPFANNTGFTLNGTSNGCTVSIPVNMTNTDAVAYGVNVVSTCPNPLPPDQFKPVVFWTISRSSTSLPPSYSLVYCTPTIQLLDASIQVALQNGTLLSASTIGNTSRPNNITDPNGLVQGRAFNGVEFNLSSADSFVQQRAQAARTELTAAIVLKAQQSPGGLPNQIQSFGMIPITETLYELYLSLVAKEIYFVPAQGSLTVATKTFQSRLWLVDVTVHLLTGILIAFAIFGALVHTLHYRVRDLAILPYHPGTLASAAAYTARSNVGEVLDGYYDSESLARVLKDKRFRVDRRTGRLVMEGDEGYETGEALPPNPRRSMFDQILAREK